jgi:hypothetical protein
MYGTINASWGLRVACGLEFEPLLAAKKLAGSRPSTTRLVQKRYPCLQLGPFIY